MKEITFEIIEHYGVFGETSSGWTKEVNLVSWNNKEPKIDIRSWDPHHEKSAKISTVSKEAANALGEILIKL